MATVDARDIALEQPVPELSSKLAPARAYTAPTLLLIAIGTWLLAIGLVRDETAGEYGLLTTTGGRFLLLSALVGIAAFVVAIAKDDKLYAVLAIAVVTVIHRVTVTLITDVPIYTWTYKHIGIVDYMMSDHSSPHPHIYGDWPGFFAAMAWFSTVSGLNPVDAAHWFAPVVDALISLMVGTLALCAGANIRAALIAAMLAGILNWTGQDYYSPQAIGLIMALAILALLSYSKKMTLSGHISVPIFAVLVATHQLTPVWLCVLTVALALAGQIRPRFLAAIYAALLIIYVLPRRERVDRFGMFSGFNPLKNSTVVVTHRGSDGREFTILVERLLSVSVWLLAAICFLLIWRRSGAPWALGIMAFSSMLILGGQSYGGEAIIRVFLYSIAGCAVLLAIVAARAFDLSKRRQKVLGCGATMLALAAIGTAGMQGYYGGWSYITIERTQLEHSRQLLATTGGALVIGNIAPTAGWPDASTAGYVRLKLRDPGFDSALDDVRKSLLHKEVATSEDVEILEGAAPKKGPTRTLYVVFPRQVVAYGEYVGWFPTTFIPSLIARLSVRPGWTKVADDANTVIFAYTTVRKRP